VGSKGELDDKKRMKRFSQRINFATLSDFKIVALTQSRSMKGEHKFFNMELKRGLK
jgi:hypothetical protein